MNVGFEVMRVDPPLPTSPLDIRLDEVEAPLVLCEADGRVHTMSDDARSLLGRFQMVEKTHLAKSLWSALAEVSLGSAIEWRSPEQPVGIVGCTRYRVGERFLLLMKEVSEQHLELSRRLHRQRMETSGRLMASIAHELRSSVAGVVYSVDLLGITDPSESKLMKDALRDCTEASLHLQQTLNHLLAYARTGMAPAVPVSLADVLSRAQGFLRGFYRRGSHQLTINIPEQAEWVRGNSLAVEQVFVNLLINAAEAASEPISVAVTSELQAAEGEQPMVCVRVQDNGPGVPCALRDSIFQPFFTTRENGTGLGLTNAVEAAESMDGRLELEKSEVGATFAVYLPCSLRNGQVEE